MLIPHYPWALNVPIHIYRGFQKKCLISNFSKESNEMTVRHLETFRNIQSDSIFTEIEKIFERNINCHGTALRGSFFMFVESGCISTNIEFMVP